MVQNVTANLTGNLTNQTLIGKVLDILSTLDKLIDSLTSITMEILSKALVMFGLNLSPQVLFFLSQAVIWGTTIWVVKKMFAKRMKRFFIVLIFLLAMMYVSKTFLGFDIQALLPG